MEKSTYGVPTQFGYELLRDHVLPSILGPHESDILYWSGKEIARKFPVFNVEELPTFFLEAGWGSLTLEKEAKNEAFFKLKNDSEYINIKERTFHLEAGFIAEQYQKLNGVLTECFAEKINKRNDPHILIHVKWDPKTKI
ncbi:YslB family protein [Sporosarcina sp. CAU 1771]